MPAVSKATAVAVEASVTAEVEADYQKDVATVGLFDQEVETEIAVDFDPQFVVDAAAAVDAAAVAVDAVAVVDAAAAAVAADAAAGSEGGFFEDGFD